MKKLIIVSTLLLCTSSIVSASSVNGDFEGSPIVAIKSNGQELKVEDVPAINYKNRTLVPIYLLKQLGADVVWNQDTYSVDVKIKNEQQLVSEQSRVKDTYHWLSDTDSAIWMFLVNLQQYSNLNNPKTFLHLIDMDFDTLIKQNDASLTFATRNYSEIKMKNNINEILVNQSKLIQQVTETKNLFKIWATSDSSSDINSNLKISLLNSLRASQQNIMSTNDFIHELMK